MQHSLTVRGNVSEEHKLSCRMREMACLFCGANVAANKMQQHRIECAHRPVECTLGCWTPGSNGQFFCLSHLDYAPIYVGLKANTLKTHLEKNCPNRSVECRCGVHVKVQSLTFCMLREFWLILLGPQIDEPPARRMQEEAISSLTHQMPAWPCACITTCAIITLLVHRFDTYFAYFETKVHCDSIVSLFLIHKFLHTIDTTMTNVILN